MADGIGGHVRGLDTPAMYETNIQAIVPEERGETSKGEESSFRLMWPPAAAALTNTMRPCISSTSSAGLAAFYSKVKVQLPRLVGWCAKAHVDAS